MDLPTTTSQRFTARESEALWRAWAVDGDVAARDRLVLAYSPMVKYLASRKVRELPAHCELDDLASCGLVALIEAVDRFDPAKGATFEQYAWTRVAGAIMDELRRQDWASRNVRRTSRRIEEARERWYVREGAPPSEEELAKLLLLSVAQLRKSLEEADHANLVSLNAPVRANDDGQSIEVGDTLSAPDRDEPAAVALDAERVGVLRAAIADLSERERHLLSLIYVQERQGIEVGEMLGISESRVSQILGGIRQKLRAQVDTYEREAAMALDRSTAVA